MQVNPDLSNIGAELAWLRHAIPVTARRLLLIGGQFDAVPFFFRLRLPLLSFCVVPLRDAEDARDGASLGPDDRILYGSLHSDSVREALSNESFDGVVLWEKLTQLTAPLAVLRFLATIVDGKSGKCYVTLSSRAEWSAYFDAMRQEGHAVPSEIADDGYVMTESLQVLVKHSGSWSEARLEYISPISDDKPVQQNRISVEHSTVLQFSAAAEQAISLEVVGVNCVDFAGIYQVRIEQPNLPIRWLDGSRYINLEDVASWDDPARRVILFYRPKKLHNAKQIDDLAERGTLFVADLDDDYFTDRTSIHKQEDAAIALATLLEFHACSVSTPEIARRLEKYHPCVRCFPNAVEAMLPSNAPTGGSVLRFFFGALNRSNDWAMLQPCLVELCRLYGDRLEFHILFDKAFFDMLPTERKSFYGLVPRPNYMQILNQCHVSFMPLGGDAFNEAKSDLKMIEALAMGALPICSPLVYGNDPRHRDYALFFEDSAGLRRCVETALDQPQLCADIIRVGRAYLGAERLVSCQVLERAAWYQELQRRYPELEQARLERLPSLRG